MRLTLLPEILTRLDRLSRLCAQTSSSRADEASAAEASRLGKTRSCDQHVCGEGALEACFFSVCLSITVSPDRDFPTFVIFYQYFGLSSTSSTLCVRIICAGDSHTLMLHAHLYTMPGFSFFSELLTSEDVIFEGIERDIGGQRKAQSAFKLRAEIGCRMDCVDDFLPAIALSPPSSL